MVSRCLSNFKFLWFVFFSFLLHTHKTYTNMPSGNRPFRKLVMHRTTVIISCSCLQQTVLKKSSDHASIHQEQHLNICFESMNLNQFVAALLLERVRKAEGEVLHSCTLSHHVWQMYLFFFMGNVKGPVPGGLLK